MFSAKHWGWKWYVLIVAISGIKSMVFMFLTIFWIVCGALVAEHFRKMWGVSGYIIGFLIGFVISSGFTWIIGLSDTLLFRPLPVCRRGKCCGIGDYTWQIGIRNYTCNCGDKYIFKVKEKKFTEVLPDGKERPYKKLVGFHKWADDPE
jgi:hypothetical protein